MTRKEMVEQLADVYAKLMNKQGIAEYEAEFEPSEAVKEMAFMTIERVKEGLKEIEQIADNHNVLTMVKELGDHYYRTNY